jgi:glucose-6-phosphate dehydrogenase assembly protein OpcA
MIDLIDTSSSAIAAELVRARRRSGSPAMGMIMTLVIVADDSQADEALEAARSASREHPARILVVVTGDKRGAGQVDAQVGIGSGVSGERAVLRLSGEVTRHAESVVLPLLLPDSPVVVWWPGRAPDDPAHDPLGRLGTRRITDAASVPTARAKAMLTQCHSYAPGNTDLAWTRITGWRALLAAALDQHPGTVTSASVTAERISPSADLLSAWLGDRLRVPVTRHHSQGPGITAVVLGTPQGDITITRSDGRLATLSSPNAPDRPVALKRRDLDELLSEELRRLDPDDVYAATVKQLARTGSRAVPTGTKKGAAPAPATKTAATKSTARKAATKGPAKKTAARKTARKG